MKLIKAGNKIFNVDAITVIGINKDDLRIKTMDCNPGDHYSMSLHTPEGQAFLKWLTEQSIDVMAPEHPEPSGLQVLETPYGMKQ